MVTHISSIYGLTLVAVLRLQFNIQSSGTSIGMPKFKENTFFFKSVEIFILRRFYGETIQPKGVFKCIIVFIIHIHF